MQLSDENHYVYLLLTQTGKLYCGYTNDLDKRLEAHKSGKASKFTRANKAIKFVYTKRYETKSEALKEEYRIKQLTKTQKEKLIETQYK